MRAMALSAATQSTTLHQGLARCAVWHWGLIAFGQTTKEDLVCGGASVQPRRSQRYIKGSGYRRSDS